MLENQILNKYVALLLLKEIGHKVLYLMTWAYLPTPANLLDLAIKKNNYQTKALATNADGNRKFLFLPYLPYEPKRISLNKGIL